jgi:hypothetical protein
MWDKPAVGSAEPLVIETSCPVFDAVRREHLVLDAAPDLVYATARELDFLDVHSGLTDAAMAVRSVTERIAARFGRPLPPEPESVRLAGLFDGDGDDDGGESPMEGWIGLGERPPREIAFGAVGHFWTPAITWRTVTREQFDAFAEPGWGKIAAAILTRPYGSSSSLVSYEARTRCADAASRRAFLRYWRLVSPFVGRIMRATLATIGEQAGEPDA